MAAETTTIRVSLKTKNELAEIAQERGESLTATMEAIVREHRRRLWLEEVARGYTRMRESSSDWDDELDRRAQWDQAVADGLEKEP